MGQETAESLDDISVLNPINFQGNSARSIALGPDFSCVVLNNGNLQCWGLADGGATGADWDDKGVVFFLPICLF